MALEPSSAVADYRFWADERVRFFDLDPLGHVNNVAYTIYVESGRAAFLHDTGFWLPNTPARTVIARLEVNFRQELKFPNELRVGMNVLAIGRSSFSLGTGIFVGDICHSTAVSVVVGWDHLERKSRVLDEQERALLQPWRLNAA